MRKKSEQKKKLAIKSVRLIIPRSSEDQRVQYSGFEEHIILGQCERSSEPEPQKYDPYRKYMQQKAEASLKRIFGR